MVPALSVPSQEARRGLKCRLESPAGVIPYLHLVFEFLGLVSTFQSKPAGVRAQRDFHALLDAFESFRAFQFRHPSSICPPSSFSPSASYFFSFFPPPSPFFSCSSPPPFVKPARVSSYPRRRVRSGGLSPSLADRVRRHFLVLFILSFHYAFSLPL